MHSQLKRFFDELEQECGVVQPVSMGLANLLDATRAHLSTLGCINIIEFGSTFSGTSLERYSDRDYLALFPVERMSRNPGFTLDIMSVMMRPLINGASSRGEVNWPAVRLWPIGYESESIDVVPGVEAYFLHDGPSPQRSGLVSYAFPSSREEWVGVMPKLHFAVLDLAHHDCRWLIRLLKLWKYRNEIPIRSFFLEMFVLRWLENSHWIDLGSATEIVDKIIDLKEQGLYRQQTYGDPDQNIASMLSELGSLLRSQRFRNNLPRLADLACPEFVSWAYPCNSETELPDIIMKVEQGAERAALAVQAGQHRDIQQALKLWRTLFDPQT